MHNPLDVTDIVPTPILLAALAPVMLRIAGEHASGTILWMADERAIGDHIVPRITKAAEEAGRPRPRVVAGIPVALCANDEVDAARARANQVLGHAEYSPNYERLLEQGDATDVGDLLAAGDESAVVDAAAELPRRGRHRPLGADPADRARPRRAHRVVAPHRGVPRHRSAPSSDVTVSTAGPLAGIRVLEVGHILAGPFGGMLLADLGADVIKIEPIDGDLSRQVGSRTVDEHNVYFASLNRNKRSVHIDLTTADGQAELGALAATAHALLVNLRPSAIRKLGLDYESLRRFNPKIVCVALTGYGLDGPAAEWPAFDYVIQAGDRRRGHDGRARRAARRSPATRRSTTRRGSWPRSGSWRRSSRARAARSTSRSSTSCSRSSTTRPRPTSTAARRRRASRSARTPSTCRPSCSRRRPGHLALFVTHDEFWRRLCAEIDRPSGPTTRASRRCRRGSSTARSCSTALGASCRRRRPTEWVGAPAPARDRRR